jgi:thiol-disulfide isomerase/thioredoxin
MTRRTLLTAVRPTVAAAILLAVLVYPAATNAARPLPKFQAKLVDGNGFTPESIAGKVAVIDFWGTWCLPCLKEIPQYNELVAEFGPKGLVMVGVAVQSGTAEKVRAEAARLKMNYAVAAPDEEQLKAFGDIPVYPTTWVVNRKGQIVKVFAGTPGGKHKDLRKLVNRLLSSK